MDANSLDGGEQKLHGDENSARKYVAPVNFMAESISENASMASSGLAAIYVGRSANNSVLPGRQSKSFGRLSMDRSRLGVGEFYLWREDPAVPTG